MEIKFLKRKKKFRKGGLGIKPDLYWRYILYVTFVLIILSFAFGFYLFMRINKEPNLSVASVNRGDLIKKERIDKVLEYFKEREKKSAEILNSPSLIVDPSL
jgi:cell shape-determining protein MreC